MSDDDIRLLMNAMGIPLFGDRSDPTGTMSILFSETIKFRDKLKEDTGKIFTVGDTRKALEALENYLNGKTLPEDLTLEQKALTQIWIDRLTLFN